MGVSQRNSQDQRVAEKLGQKSIGHSSSLLLYMGVAAVLAGYAAYPSKSNPLHSAIFLSYPLPPKFDSGPTQYGKGPKDVIFVAFYTLVLFAARDFIREYLARAVAKSWGVTDEDKQTKFIQQLYQAIYFAAISLFGFYVMKRTPVWFFNMPGLFDGFPHETLDAPFKVFYLVQSANWVQQALVTFLMLEKARKDTAVMVAHHLVTLSAIPLVYKAHMTYFALALIIPHDISDSLLAVSQLYQRFPCAERNWICRQKVD
jgi:very-long-chain ceramide synthase